MHKEIDIKRIIRVGQIAIFLTFVGVGSWVALAPLHGAVVATGLVKVDANRKTVQHNEGGIVKQIFVRDGDRVVQGQSLIVLEDSQVVATYRVLRSALDAELVRAARLQAEAGWGKNMTFPIEHANRQGEAAISQKLERETALFRARRSSLGSQIQLLQEQIAQTGKEADALRAQMQEESYALSLAGEELQKYTALHDKQFLSGTKLSEQKRLVSDYRSRMEERRADIARTERTRDELRLRIAVLRSDYSRGATEELKDSTARLVELNERLQPSEDALRRQSIRAPVSGTVLSLRVNTIGSSIGAREPLLDIVPDSGPLVIEANAPVDSIKELHQDQAVDIRFTALPYRSTPLVKGRLVYVSPDAITDQQGRVFYQMHVLPEAEAMRMANIPQLQPGMAAEVYIQTESRTALEYLLKPVTDSLMRAFRER